MRNAVFAVFIRTNFAFGENNKNGRAERRRKKKKILFSFFIIISLRTAL